MLTRLDDYLVHQTPETVDHVYSGDRNFYDRYYFNAHTLDGRVFLVVAMGQYPNAGVIDAFVTCVVDGTVQHIVRASRALGADRMDARAGPIRVEVLEGLRKMRVVVEPSEHPIAMDMTFEGSAFPYEEPRLVRRAGNRTIMDYTRLTQTGRWSGTLTVAGTTYDVRPATWYGARDHSWGIRPLGGPEPPSAPAPAAAPPGVFWVWTPVQFDAASMVVSGFENSDGTRWHTGAQLFYPEGDAREPEPLAIARHQIAMVSGTRSFNGGSITVARPDGREATLRMTPKSTIYMAGAGYTYLGSGWRHGQYHAPLAVEGETWDLRDPALLQRIAGQTETVCDYTVDGMEELGTGHGITELLVIGSYLPYGLNAWNDVAK